MNSAQNRTLPPFHKMKTPSCVVWSRRFVATILFAFATILFGTPAARGQAVWLHEQRVDEIAYFLFENRIERVNLTKGAFLSTIALPRSGATSFRIAENDTWVAYGSDLYRYDSDLSGETLFLTVDRGEVTDLHLHRDFIIVSHPGPDRSRLATHRLSDAALIDRSEYFNDDFEKVTFDPIRETIFFRGDRNSFIDAVPVSPDGTLASSNDTDSPDFIKRTWLWPDGSVLVDGRGNLFNPLDLFPLGSLPTRVAALDFYQDRLPVVYRDNRLYGIDQNLNEAGSVAINQNVETLFVSNTNARLFFPSNGSRGLGIRTVPLASIGLSGNAPVAPDPRELDFEANEIFLDRDENVILYSRLHRTVFRWSSEECRYLDPIPLEAAPPEFVTYDPGTHSLFFINKFSEVYSLRLEDGAEFTSRGFALPQREFGRFGYLGERIPSGIIPIDDKLLIARRSGGSFKQFDIIDHDTNLITEGSGSFSGNFRLYWEPISRRVFGLDQRGGTNRTLLRSDLGEDNRFGRVWDIFDIPGRGTENRLSFNDDASLIVTTGGTTVTPDWQDEEDFGRNSIDVYWSGDRIRTIEAGENQTTTFRNFIYQGAENPPVTIEGEPRRIFELSEDRSLVVSQFEDGPLFSILNEQDIIIHNSIESPPSISTAPLATRVDFGGTVTLQTQVTGSGPFTYQWFKDGQAIEGADQTSLTLENAGSNDQGYYHVRVTNEIGEVESAPVPLGVGPIKENPFTNGSLLITTDNRVREFALDGVLRQSITLPPPGSEFPSNRIRRLYDAGIDRFGRLHVISQIEIPNFSDFNGPAYLSTWDPEFNHWRQLEIVSPRFRDIFENPAIAKLFFVGDWLVTLHGRHNLINPRDFEIPNPEFLEGFARFNTGLDGSLFRRIGTSSLQRINPDDWSIFEGNIFEGIDREARVNFVVSGEDGTIYFTTSEGQGNLRTHRAGKFSNGEFQFTPIPSAPAFPHFDIDLSTDGTIVSSGTGEQVYLFNTELEQMRSFRFQQDGDRSAATWVNFQEFPEAESAIAFPATTDEDAPFAVALQFSHPDPDARLRITDSDLPDWMSLSENGVLSGTPEAADIGSTLIQILVRDQADRPTILQYPLEVLEVDDPVIIEDFEITTIEDAPPSEINLADLVSDEESPFDQLTLRATLPEPLEGATPPVSIEIADGIIVVTTLPDLNGNTEITLIASDGDAGREISKVIPVQVIPVNDPPIVQREIADLTAPADGSSTAIILATAFLDIDAGDTLSFSLVENSNPAIFDSISLDSETGQLSLSFAPYLAGTSSLTISATDRDGLSVQDEFEVTLPELPQPNLALASGNDGRLDSEMTLNRQTGLFEQKISLTNIAARAIGGFKISVGGLDAESRLFSGQANEFTYASPIPAGEQVTLTLEYFSRSTRDTLNPKLDLELILPESSQEANADGTSPPGRVKVLADRSILLDFETEPGKTYEIQYTIDLQTWVTSPVPINAVANRTQWLDQGLPRTNCHPSDCPSRMYRIRKSSP